jgi:hypothetical protein
MGRERPVGADEIERIMRETRMVTVYPILHASAALNYLEFPENKLLAESHSGMLTLHGLVEQPNRRALLNSIARLHTETLPQLRNELASSVKDADNAIPQALVVLAQKMLKKHNALEELQLDVRKDFIKAKTDMREVIEGYFFGDADVYEILAAARTTGRRRRWDELKAKVKSTRSALQLLDRNAGSKAAGSSCSRSRCRPKRLATTTCSLSCCAPRSRSCARPCSSSSSTGFQSCTRATAARRSRCCCKRSTTTSSAARSRSAPTNFGSRLRSLSTCKATSPRST